MRKLSSALMMALLVTILSIEVEAQFEEFVPYIPDSSQVGLIYWRQSGISYINITIEFPNTGFHISSSGTPNTTGNNISVDAEIWRYTGLSFPVITTVSHTYNLGDLPCGQYDFLFEVWGSSVKNIAFVVSPGIIVPDDYSSIQEAINAAGDGDTIFVRNGTYYENVVVNKSISLIGEDRINTIIDGNRTGTVVHIIANNVSIKRFTIQNAGSHVGLYFSGIYLDSKNNCNITGNSILDSDYGVRIRYSSNNTVSGNMINCSHGISLQWSSNNTVCGNNVTTSEWYSIWLDYSSENVVSRNIVTNGDYYGIRLYSSSNNVLRKNSMTNNRYNFHITDSSHNTFTGNDIADNDYGMFLVSSSNNTIYPNNFINNTVQAYSDSVNTWDNGYEGNCWSNYNGTDVDGDGVGDIPYVIDGNNTDNYPLVNPYWNPADVNHDLKVDIYDVVLACSAYTSTPSDPHWNPHCDIAEPYGVIDIYDIVMICSSYGEEYLP